MKTSQGDIQIYVACLASYNNGHLHGAWISAEQEPCAIYDEVQVMLAASPMEDTEEWAIHDHEGFEVDLSRFRAAPSARLSHLPFERDWTFPAQC